MGTTNAERFLRQKKIAFEVREYEYKVKGAQYAAQALKWPVESMIKTLVVALSDGSFCVCLLPGNAELSLKKLAREAGVKSARMTTPEEAEKLTGYHVGGISPFGTRKSLTAWLHKPLLDHERVGINGGHRGLIAFLDPGGIRDALGARVADIAA